MISERASIEHVDVVAYTIPTDQPEADGTLQWDATTMIVVHVASGDCRGCGWTYAHAAAASVIRETLASVICGGDAFDIATQWHRMNRQIRNIGRPGIGLMAIAAVDTALWDLKAKLLDVSVLDLLGRVRNAVPIYGSGGFTSYTIDELTAQLAGWVGQGIPRVKMKVGSRPDDDQTRVRAARDAIGDAALMVDANGAYRRKQALNFAAQFREQDVIWFEEPLPSDDLDGLRVLRDQGPPGMAITAGEYGWDAQYFRRMLASGAVDIVQADATRCGGFTGFMQVDALCLSFGIPLSAHCAPALHVHVGCAAESLVHLEYFHDHVRIEQMAFDGVRQPESGALTADARPGMGYALRAREMERYRNAL